jgi:hypothetical protein
MNDSNWTLCNGKAIKRGNNFPFRVKALVVVKCIQLAVELTKIHTGLVNLPRRMSPAAPALGSLRIASPKNIMRIGIVAACGFRYSPVFQWERPYHERYPEDTLLSYRQEFSEVMKNPEFIVLVAVDKYDPEESKKSKAIIPPKNGAVVPSEGEEVVVGVGCWKLEKGSKRVGQFQNDTGDFNDCGSWCLANLAENLIQICRRIRIVI